jgi:hypothetical protein
VTLALAIVARRPWWRRMLDALPWRRRPLQPEPPKCDPLAVALCDLALRRAARRLDIADAGRPVQIVRGDAPYAAVVEYGRPPPTSMPGPGRPQSR